ncbi:NACHT domain-containing protein [Actinoplanes sp. HUAS TT8]|uniref:NACHT domain-containing protein n=1 Tax=Actinoplanes sp. HUAS TT8 TaxID=3447453 RepID=UPI003F51DEA8
MSGQRGGVANEAGSAHRRGVAVFLAAYGLAGRSVPRSIGSFVPVSLAFETDHETDDLACRDALGRAMYISAKRACGNDQESLGGTVDQWVAQAGSLGPGDMLVLAAAELKGDIKALPAALARRREAPGTPMEAAEKRALTALVSKINAATSDRAVAERVLDAAVVLTVDAVRSGDPGFELAAALLENTLVPAGDGPAAVRALSEAFHTQAANAYASTLDDWVRLIGATITVYADGQGSPGATARACQIAVDSYRRRLATEAGRVDLALLADDLPPLVVADLAAGLQVTVIDDDGHPHVEKSLLAVARRWPRLTLTGLPGMGKSTALRQLAATWADDPRAPLPILVRLPSLVDRCHHAGDVTLTRLCEIAGGTVPAGQRFDLLTALEYHCRQGHVVLLLDGLDECGARKAVISDGLHALIEGLPPEAGVLLTTRRSGISAARKLRLPEADLDTPGNLGEICHALLEHIAEARRVPAAQRDRWTATRRAWLAATRRDHRDIADVPLLATLMTLVAADSTDAPPDRGPARILRTAVEHSVLRWEEHRRTVIGSRSGEPSPAQLIDGFVALGRRLAVAATTTRAEAVAAVADMLANRWGITGRGQAAELTDHVLNFWDHHVGVFVRSGDGIIVPRSRVFVELAAGMAVSALPDEALANWVIVALADADQEAALQFAGQLDPRIPDLLLGESTGAAPATRALVTEQLFGLGTPAGDHQLSALIDLLISAVDRGNTGIADSGAVRWLLLSKLAGLKLPAGPLRDRRRQLLSRFGDPVEQLHLIACAMLADANVDQRLLDGSEVGPVRTLLTLSAPQPDEPVIRRVLLDRRDIVVEVVRHIEVLGADMVVPIHEIARLGRSRALLAVEDALVANGHEVPPVQFHGLRAVLFPLFDPPFRSMTDLDVALMQSIVALSDDPAPLSAFDRWRLPALNALIDLIGVREAAIGDFAGALENPAFTAWLRAAVAAADIDPDVVAAEAAAALDDHDQGDDIRDFIGVVTPRSPRRFDVARLDEPDRASLVRAVATAPPWIAGLARDILAGRHEPGRPFEGDRPGHTTSEGGGHGDHKRVERDDGPGESGRRADLHAGS